MAKFLFLTRMFVDKGKKEEDEFNGWYWEEHIPVLTQVPGVLSARRYQRTPTHYPDAPKYMAIYELESSGVIEGNEWNSWAYSSEWAKRTKPHREGTPGVYEEIIPGDGGKIEASYLYINRIYPKPNQDDFFREWAEKTLFPEVKKLAGISKARLYYATGKAHKHTPKFLILVELKDLKVINGKEWKKLSGPEGVLTPVRDIVLLKNFPGVYQEISPPPEASDLVFRW